MKEKMDRFVDAMFVVWFLVLLVIYCGAGTMQVLAADTSEDVGYAEISESTEHAESLTVETPEIKMPEIPVPEGSEVSKDSEDSEDLEIPKTSETKDEEYLRKYFREPLYTVGVNTTGTKYRNMSVQQLKRQASYFDFARFITEYFEDNRQPWGRMATMMMVGNRPRFLTAEESPFDTPTTVYENSLVWMIRIYENAKDIDPESLNYKSDANYTHGYLDLCTYLNNDGEFHTQIIAYREGKYYGCDYYGKSIPRDIVISSPTFDTNGEPMYAMEPFIMERDAFLAFLKMAEAEVLLDEKVNPFEATGEKFSEVSDSTMWTRMYLYADGGIDDQEP